MGSEGRTFGQLLHQYRVAAGLTQEELAERASLSARAISDLERSARTRPRPYTLQQIAEALDLRAADRTRLDGAARSGPYRVPREATALPVGNFLGARPAAPLVARDQQLAQLLQMVQAVEAGSGRAVTLAGEAGVGKTRLVQEVTLRLGERGFLVATGRCYEGFDLIPYYPLREALPILAGAAGKVGGQETTQRWPSLGRLFAGEDVMAAPSEPGPQDQGQLFQAVTNFLHEVARQAPVALLVDDLHWSDTATLDLLQHVIHQTREARVLLVGTYCDIGLPGQHPLLKLVHGLSRELLLERIELHRLDQDETGKLMAMTLGESQVSTEFASLVQQQTEGNPFFVLEVLCGLIERGELSRDGDRWMRRELDEIVVAQSVREAIGERVERLPETAQDVLHEASVLGQTFRFEDLLAMGDREEIQLEEAMESAASLGLVQDVDDEAYGFDHALTRETLYAELPQRRRRKLHQAAGAAMERLPEREQTRRVAEIGGHLLRGGERERALPHLLQAGDAAEAVFAHQEAERQYRLALGLADELGDSSRRAEVLEKLGTALLLQTKYGEARDNLERSVEIYRLSRDMEGLGRVTAQIGRVYLSAGWATAEAVERLRSLVDRLEDGVPSVALVEVHTRLATLFFLSGDYQHLFAEAETALSLARLVDEKKMMGEAEFHRGLAFSLIGTFEEASRSFSAATRTAEEAGDLINLCEGVGGLGVVTLLAGDARAARGHLERAVEVAGKVGNPWQIGLWEGCLGLQSFIVGEWREARDHLDRSLSMGEHSRIPYALWQMGWLELAQGAWEAAAELLDRSVTIAERTGNLQAVRWAAGLRAELELLQGKPRSTVEHLHGLLDRPGMREVDVTFLLPRLAWAKLELGKGDEADRISAEAVERGWSQDYHLALTDGLRVRGAVLASQDRWDEARQVFEAGVSLTRSMPYPYAEGRLLAEWGRMEMDRPDVARQLLEEALVIFQQLGARPYIQRTDKVLVGLR
jgi:tetratricopeptide (TPR) repeat protein/transcriptional regulator with XRE-family HTH domain